MAVDGALELARIRWDDELEVGTSLFVTPSRCFLLLALPSIQSDHYWPPRLSRHLHDPPKPYFAFRFSIYLQLQHNTGSA